MNRDDLLNLTRTHRTQPDIGAALAAYFSTDAGQQALRAAPGVQSESGMRPMTATEAVNSLIEEARDMEIQYGNTNGNPAARASN